MPRGTRNTHAALWTSLGIIAATATLLAFIGCSNDDDKNPVNPGGGGTQTTSFSGMFAGGAGSGTLGITINSTSLARGIHGAAAAVVSASGTIRLIGGGSVTLTGSYDTVLDTLYLAGGGYIIRGTYDDTVSFTNTNDAPLRSSPLTSPWLQIVSLGVGANPNARPAEPCFGAISDSAL